QREGRHPAAADYYRRLPSVAPGDPYARDWQVRRETYHHLLGHVLAGGPLPLRVLDLGAGSGWLSHRLAALGHQPVAVDAIDEDGSAMVGSALQRFICECGCTDVFQPGQGYLTFSRLAGIADKLALRAQFVPSRGPLGWRVRRGMARVRLRRAPAAFGLWVAR